MEHFWHLAPFLRLLIPLVIGILFGIYQPANIQIPFWIPLAWLMTLFYLHYNRSFLVRYRHLPVFGWLFFLSFLCAGYFLTLNQIEHLNKNHFTYVDSPQFAMGIVVETPEEKERSQKIQVEIISLKDSLGWKQTIGKALIYLEKSDRSRAVQYGDQLLFKARFSEISPPQNPEEFNYKRYLYFHQIYRQGYLQDFQWEKLASGRGPAILQLTQNWRAHLLGVFKELPLGEKERGVAEALVLGYKVDLTADLKSAYASAGAMHVLAVSGLHVGIIFFIVSSLLGFLGPKRRIPKAAITILCIWIFAGITGLSASVMRAATMFTFIILASASGRNASIYNTLAVSAFFLLLINPFLIMEVGFQLSYLAVLGIVYFQPRIYRLMAFRTWLGDKIWAITAVSLAAQIATFPLGLLYFHQFPNYFLLSNLLVIPAAILILYLGLAALLLSPIKILAWVLAKLLHWLIFVLNFLIGWVEELPFAIYQGASINIAETWLIYTMMILISLFFNFKNARWAHLALGAIVVLAGLQLFEKHQHLSQQRMLVYNVNKTPAINFIEGRQALLLSHPEFYDNESRLLFHVQHYWWARGVDEIEMQPAGNAKEQDWMLDGNFAQLGDKRLAIVNADFPLRPANPKIEVDFLILSGYRGRDLKAILSCFSFDELVIDSSNPQWKVKSWLQEADTLGLQCHAVSIDGAWEKVL